MQKREFIKLLAKNLSVDNKLANDILKTVTDTISEGLETTKDVSIKGFGRFSVIDRLPKKGFNMWTKEVVNVNGYKAITFKPGVVLKKKFNS